MRQYCQFAGTSAGRHRRIQHAATSACDAGRRRLRTAKRRKTSETHMTSPWLLEPRYVPDQSNPAEQEYVFRLYGAHYTIPVNIPAQVISRHWIITDGNQRVREVRGLGVVGQQPLLAARRNLRIQYQRLSAAHAWWASMRGSYHCVGENGIPFEVADRRIPAAPCRATLH